MGQKMPRHAKPGNERDNVPVREGEQQQKVALVDQPIASRRRAQKRDFRTEFLAQHSYIVLQQPAVRILAAVQDRVSLHALRPPLAQNPARSAGPVPLLLREHSRLSANSQNNSTAQQLNARRAILFRRI